MVWSYAYTPSIWPSILTGFLLATLAVYIGRRRSVAGAYPLMIACLFAVTWAAGSVLEYAALDFEAQIFWVKFQAVWQLPIITAVTCFVLEYVWPGRWLSPRNLVLLSLPCLLTLGMILTNDIHHLMWGGFTYQGSVQPQLALGGWIVLIYVFVVTGALNLFVFIWLFLHFPHNYGPAALMLFGQISGRSLALLVKVDLLQSALPVDMFGMAFEFLMYAIALFGFRIFEPIPLARRTVIEQLQAGVLVLDAQDKIVHLNPSARRIFRLHGGRLKGRRIQEVLPAYLNGTVPPIDRQSEDRSAVEVELSLGDGQGIQSYTMDISPLNDWRGLEVGRLLMLRDITAQKRAQAQIMEQQRALAKLHEREHLARELHDSIGQVLGYACFQLDVVNNCIHDSRAATSAGQTADADTRLTEAESQLTRLRSIVHDAHADVREYILNLRIAPSEQRPFFTVIRQYLDGYCQNYGIQSELSVGPGLDAERLGPEAQVQLFRIIQEALSNARKHAQARHVQVSFVAQDQGLCLTVQDNGGGFDPAKVVDEAEERYQSSHFGLRFMRERAEQLGGSLRIESAPGAGTCVVVQIPGNHTQRHESANG